jgi:catechol 2,3-dioxygenase-like lactoylglutathione lyase family enzyme
MKQIICWLAVLATTAFAQQSTPRPKITGIDHVDFYTTNPQGNQHLYSEILGLASATPVEPGQIQRFIVGVQWVGYRPAPDPQATDRMDHIAFKTEDCKALQKYLFERGIRVDSPSTPEDGSHGFFLRDPAGHRIEFVQSAQPAADDGTTPGKPSDPVSRRLIHAGFIVRDRPAEDHFYQDILGFHLYWHGGMKAGETDWVAMQVPDGTDWLEYMLNIRPNPDLRTTGVMNHISLGVRDMKRTQEKLESHGWKPHGDEKMQMGRDGKWQLNVLDPDWTRVELMEFAPAQKPCCSDFQGPHPSEER